MIFLMYESTRNLKVLNRVQAGPQVVELKRQGLKSERCLASKTVNLVATTRTLPDQTAGCSLFKPSKMPENED